MITAASNCIDDHAKLPLMAVREHFSQILETHQIASIFHTRGAFVANLPSFN